jgi:hypothetical protein
MLSKNSYLRFAVNALMLLSCLGFETATAQTNRRIQNQSQPFQTEVDTKVMNLLSPEAQKYLSADDKLGSGEIIQAKHYQHCHKTHYRRVRHYRGRHRRNYRRCPCPVYHHRHYPRKVYHYHYHHYRPYYKVHPRRGYRHGIPRHENFYRH